MGLLPHGVVVKSVAGQECGFLNVHSLLCSLVAMQKCFHCLMIQRLQWSCTCTCAQTSGQWMHQDSQIFPKTDFVPAEAEKYLRSVVQDKMPQGLKRYMELALFPRIHLKVGKGISLATAWWWLCCEGFRYTSYKKGLYFDGHDHPDVVQYRHDIFLPRMKEYKARLVQYVVGNVEIEAHINPTNFVECQLVLCAHDEMTVQSNDMAQKSWVFDGEHQLRKKGVGRGIHRSDVICSIMGHLVDAGQSLEYGKNYDGYWNGEMFMKQVGTPKYYVFTWRGSLNTNQLKEKIIPTFETLHSAGYQALFLIDNSQGHAAYAEDALLVSHMNVNPGGKQARMQDGWFMEDGIKVLQAMVFSKDNPDYPNEPKGIKFVLSECGLYQSPLHGKCQSRCDLGATACCNKRILECKPDFQAQKSLVQVTFAFSFQNFTANLILLSSSGEKPRNIFETTVMEPSRHSKRTCHLPYRQFNCLPSIYGSIACIGGWMHTVQGWTQRLHKSRSESSVQKGTSHIREFPKLWLSPLISKYSNFAFTYIVMPLCGQNVFLHWNLAWVILG